MAASGSMVSDWQMMTCSSKDRLHYLYRSAEYSDLDIVFPKHEVTFRVHRLVLAMSSSVFGVMLMGPMGAGKKLTLPQDSPQGFLKLLDYMYLDQMDLESVEEALEVYTLAHKYQMEFARIRCLQYIILNLEEETALAALEVSVLYEDELLNRRTKEMLYRNPDAVMLSESVSRLSRESVRDLLKDSNMKFSSELVPFKGLIVWGKAQLGQQEEEPSGSALREKIQELLKEVRFLTMTCEEFIDNVVNTNVLSYAECIHILRAIRGADLSTVPESMPLNPSKRKRLQRMKDLDHCQFGTRLCKKYRPSGKLDLVKDLSSNKDIYIHCIEKIDIGPMYVVNGEERVIGSATCQDGVYTFMRPVALEKDKQYKIIVSCSALVRIYYPVYRGSRKVGNVMFSYSQTHYLKLYFSE